MLRNAKPSFGLPMPSTKSSTRQELTQTAAAHLLGLTQPKVSALRHYELADGTAEEIAAWARQHDLPYFDDSVHFPDARIEYDDAARDPRHEDIEVVTPHYRGAHAAGAVRSGFRRYGAGFGGRGSAGGRGGRARRGGLADELLG